MIRSLLVGVLAALVAGCGSTAVVPPASRHAPTLYPTAAPTLPPTTPLPSQTTPVASPAGTSTSLAWTPLSGLDLRGAFVAQGAVSGSTTVLLGADTKTGALASWTSTDGAHWQRHWLIGSTFGGGVPQALVAGGPGFVALGWDITPKLGTEPVVWTSPDGVDWRPDPDPSGHFATDANGIASTGSSIVVATCCDTTGVFGRPFFRTSTDGITWVETTMPTTADNAAILHVAANANGYLAISLVAEPGAIEGWAPAAWRSFDGRTWVRDSAIDKGLGLTLSGVNDVQGSGDGFTIADDGGGFLRLAPDGSVTRVEPPAPYGYPASGPAGLAWIGTPDGGSCTAAWVWAADTWRAVQDGPGVCAGRIQPQLSSFMTAFVDRGLALADGWLWVSPGTGNDGETLWALRPIDSVPAVDASPGDTPAPPASAIPTALTAPFSPSAPCPTGPASISKIMALDANDSVACFGSRPLTFRAWVVDPGEGYGGACEPVIPTWLNPCVLPDWLLAPGKIGKGQIPGQLHALRGPEVTGNLKGVSRWVNVTGHFDDPAAATCRPEAGPAAVGDPPVGLFVLRCREQFVVTRIETTH